MDCLRRLPRRLQGIYHSKRYQILQDEESKIVKEPFYNPINPDKVTESPGLLPYAHTAGGAVIKLDDLGKIKAKSLTAMKEQVGKQMLQLYQQMEVLQNQAKELHMRREISERVYQAQLSYDPIVGQVYYLYEKDTGQDVVSIISPNEWGERRYKYSRYIAKLRLMADDTWEVLHREEE